MLVCVEIAAAAVIIQYWEGALGINIAAWISIIIVIIFALNIFAVSIYGKKSLVFVRIGELSS
jgi:amino acid transporter